MSLPTSGLHDGVDEQEYHRDPRSLSSTGAKTILYEGARVFRYRQDHPQFKDAFDFGSVVHALILGVGDFTILEHDSWRTKAAQAERDEARAAGSTPILAKDHAAAQDMADAVRSNALAASILSKGRPEVSMWAADPETGVLLRGRIDWLRDDSFIDVKTVAGAVNPRDFERTAWNLRYAFQAAFYQQILALNGVEGLPPIWVVVSKDAPYECYAYQPDQDLMGRAHEDVRHAIDLYARCVETDTWPGLQDETEIHTISAPRWARGER